MIVGEVLLFSFIFDVWVVADVSFGVSVVRRLCFRWLKDVQRLMKGSRMGSHVMNGRQGCWMGSHVTNGRRKGSHWVDVIRPTFKSVFQKLYWPRFIILSLYFLFLSFSLISMHTHSCFLVLVVCGSLDCCCSADDVWSLVERLRTIFCFGGESVRMIVIGFDVWSIEVSLPVQQGRFRDQ